MKQLYPDLWQTPKELRFGVLTSHAYVLEHNAGHDMIYVAEEPETLATVKTAFGVQHLYMSHNHEISEGLANAASALDAQLVGHQNMRKFFPEDFSLDHAIETDGTATLAGGIEAIHTPGHTDNNVCYLYASPHGETYLFVGDAIYLDRGSWKTLVVTGDGGSTEDLHRSLETLGKRHVEVIITSLSIGPTEIVEVSQPQWQAIVRKLINDLG
ncbi:MBL fold metallo-hydrolase [Tropicibacter sp. R16_0]|uniref:MBL fold metallo-hydrolase n=1 Tax=Tropicibacter sp. R16_0 TaxID=2821102 RepID=UPI001AD964E6|nr:MBL fold metallo-hydrolase [Tropicibacter sp. R16_0]MBO9452047.1 MBL fold metallo-hydrolase [Tropicibacter sp. R16_0]